MFTGIITDIGTVEAIERRGDLRVRIGTRYDTGSIDLGASIACSGACLTVVETGPDWFAVDVSGETVARTAGSVWAEGARINLERALRVGDELGGHIVTGHVDGVGRIVSAEPVGDSITLKIAVPDDLAGYLAAKGSVALDGISLTVNTVEDMADGTVIGLNIIPHTAAMTTFDALTPGRPLNIEIDVLARYLGRMEELNHARKRAELSRIRHAFLSSPEEIIDEARNGRMYILVDDEDRENEGDLIIPAQMATPDAINFMAKHGRGLICLALAKERVEQLGLPLMSRNNGTRHETAFTVSIEARHGVTTGISAGDRARTIAVATDASKGPDEIVTPGHVFPLVARAGGVLVRAGHTEAAVDVSRLAGLNPSGVICEIMNEDGTMARLDDLVGFAQRHALKIGTIRDLIAYRRRYDHLVEKVDEAPFVSDYGGEWKLLTYRDKTDGDHHRVLQKGRVIEGEPTLCRVHAISVLDDILGQQGGRKRMLQRAMAEIGREGAGVIVLLAHREPVVRAADAGDEMDLRSYGIGAQILADLGVHEIVLLTNAHRNIVAIEGYGINVVGERPIPETFG